MQAARSGSLKVDETGALTTQDGQKIIGTGGPIVVSETGVPISPTGQILDEQSNELGRLKIVESEKLSGLRKVGNLRYEALDGANPIVVAQPKVAPHSLEGSNVNTVFEMGPKGKRPDANGVKLDDEVIAVHRNTAAFTSRASVLARIASLTRTAVTGG